ncbi:MAG: transglycosylase SLT domain-containing protein [Armatimonadota bacterium]|nr:transglycosylase SLT domain-containing protein [Armatimonadota bacterium]
MSARVRSRPIPLIAACGLAAAIAALAATGLSPGVALAQRSLESAVEQVRQGDCRGAASALQPTAAGDGLDAQRAAYLLGVCLTRLERHRDAADAFARAVAHPTLGAWAQVERGRALMRSGSPAEAARTLAPIAAQARATAGPSRATSAGGRLRARALLSLGEAAMAQRRTAYAVEVLTEAATLRPDDPGVWASLQAAGMAAGRHDVAGRAHAGARLARGRQLARLGEWDRAAAEFRAATTAPTSGPVAGEAWYRLGELALSGDAAAAHRAFRRAASLGWDPAASWFWTAHAARRAGMAAQAREATQMFMRVAPTGPWAGRFWYNAGLRAESAGRLADAAAHYRRVAEVAPDADQTPEARWRLGWIALRSGRLADAERLFRTAAQTAPWRSAAARAWYWAAKTLEAWGGEHRAAEASRMIRMVAEQYPFTFYGQRARARLRLPPPVVPPRVFIDSSRQVAAPAHEELALLGLDADAADAVEDALAAQPHPWLSRFAAQVYARLGDIPRSVALADDALANGVRDEDTWRLAYPKAYWAEVNAAAQAAGIDPLLLLALVREESRYDAAVISTARAVGLAQLLPTTAQALSGDPSLNTRRLQDPATNLRLGARYLRLQLDRFHGDTRLALAAYNAGPGAARRWVGLDPDPDYFIERIGYTETRAYIRRVLGSYGIYRLLW